MAQQSTRMAPRPMAVPYDPAKEKWSSYMGRFNLYLEVNGLQDAPDAKKKALFLTYCDVEIYEMADALVVEDLQAVSWDNLQRALRAHYGPSLSYLASRYDFYTRSQGDGETINSFVSDLRRVAKSCKFPDTEGMIRDRIILGIRDLALQKKLLAREEVTFQEAVNKARAAESSNNLAMRIQGNGKVHATRTDPAARTTETDSEGSNGGDEAEVYQMRKGRSSGNPWSKECSGCSGNHHRAACRFKDTICRRCDRRGHIAEVCRALQPTGKSQRRASFPRRAASPAKSYGCQRGGPKPSGGKFKKWEEAQREETSIGYAQTQLKQTDVYAASKVMATINIEQRPCKMEVDLGSYITMVSWETLKGILPHLRRDQLERQDITLRDYQGRQIPIAGKKTVHINYGKFSGKLPLTVVDRSLPSILGREWFTPLQIEIVGLHTTRTSPLDRNADAAELERELGAVFDGNLDALLAELERTTESLSVNDSDPTVCFLLKRDNKPATTESHLTQHHKATPQEAKKVEPAHNVQTHKEDADIYSKVLPPQPTVSSSSSTSVAQELDDLLACLGTIQSKVSDSLATAGQSTSAEGNTPDNLDSMLKSLNHDMQDLGIATVPKGNCASCHKPIAGKVITALGKMWHPEHFTCTHCGKEVGSQPFFERDNKAYCQEDYHQLFSPRCAYCTAPIQEKILTAMDQTWHPEHFFCTHCGTVFGDDGFQVKDGKPYCQKDFQSIFSPKCRGCDRPVMNQYLSALNAVWHPECFVCRDCACSFTDGSFFELNGQPYCELHFHQQQGTVCHGCGKPIVGRCVSAMGHKFHPEHFVCAFCLIQLHNGIFQEQNGKTYCHACFKKLFV